MNARTLQLLSKGRYRARRTVFLGYVDGKPQQTTQDDVFKGLLMPLSGRDLLLMPEGDRVKELYWLYSAEKLAINTQVEAHDFWFQVQEMQIWPDYFQYKLMRIDIGPSAISPAH